MQVEAEIFVGVTTGNGVVDRVDVTSKRKVGASSLFIGMEPERAISFIPMLYSVCARAQTVAAMKAVSLALGLDPSRSRKILWQRSVLLETAIEHLWKIHIDWADYLGIFGDRAAFAMIRKEISASFPDLYWGNPETVVNLPDIGGIAAKLRQHLREHVFGVSPEEFLAMEDIGALPDCPVSRLVYHLKEIGGREGFHALAENADFASLRMRLDTEPGFAMRPDLHGAPCETGPLARMHSHPMVKCIANIVPARFVARMLELAGLPGRLEEGGAGPDHVESARGALLHSVRIEDGRISRYGILAPTEWNFHPQGALARGLLGLDAGGDLGKIAEALILSLDPCTGFELRINNA